MSADTNNEVLRGTVQRVFFTNTANTYSVFVIYDYNDERIVCTVNAEAPKEGDELELKGRFVEHKKYGEQFSVFSMQKVKPDTIGGAKLYLLNLGVKGFGEKSVDKVLAHFGESIVDVLQSDNPSEIMDVPNIRKSVKEDLYNTLRGEGILSDINQFLEDAGLSSKWSRILYDTYGARAIDALRDNPYTLMRLDHSVTFSMADTLAKHLEIPLDDDRRLEAAVFTIIDGIEDSGHSCLPADELIGRIYNLLGDFADEIAARIEDLLQYGQLVGEEHEGSMYIYTPALYYAESEGAGLTSRLLENGRDLPLDVEGFIEGFGKEQRIDLGDEQKDAIRMAFGNTLSVITGGPGTGKTTIVRALADGFSRAGLSRVLLCAPTGRAAKRLTEATGYEAMTIHRLLMPVQGGESYEFTKNEDDPLEADVIIVDEASMLNIRLYHALLAAVPPTAYVVIVGDLDQLPPIGAGFVLRDLLDSEAVPFTRLSAIYRQQKGNRIVANAHLINEGKLPDLTSNEDFEFIEVHTIKDMMAALVAVYLRELAQSDDPLDIQIISPMRKGAAGSVAISKAVQDAVNSDPSVGEITSAGRKFRVGDKVIQVLNNYDLEVYNGEIGIIYAISKTDVFIRFVDKELRVSVEDLESLMSAYAITVHKSQGSEYEVVIIPFIPPYSIMLQRKLLYTAVTRARRKVVLVGTPDAVAKAVATGSDDDRYTLFKERLQGVV